MSKLKDRLYSVFGGIALVAGIASFLTSAPVAMVVFVIAASVSGAVYTGLTAQDTVKAKLKPAAFLCSAAVTAATAIAFLPAAQPLRQRIKDVFSKTALSQKHEKATSWDAKITANPYGLKSV
ncbi:MAG: hypothetical protein K8R48_09670 [Alphaproteobacteria bacterium]|nr:hypothetical protein [Alphaproteobacteria bacterium]